jgi:fibronectin-binding autotransporter adhesin
LPLTHAILYITRHTQTEGTQIQVGQRTKRCYRSRKSRARLIAALAVGVYAGAPATRAMADTWVWTGGGIVNDWGTAANWDHTSGSSSSATPISSPNTTVDFAGSTSTTAIQDISNPIELNSLGFNSGASSLVLTGDGLDFVNSSTSVAPTIVQNSSNAQDVLESITLGNNTTISGSGTGAVELLNPISGSGSLTDSATATVDLLGSNSYSGGTTLNSGQLVINSNKSLGSTLGHVTLNGGTITATSNAALNYNYDDLSATSPITFQAAAGVTLTLGGGADLASPETLDFGSSTETGTVDFSPGIASVTNATLNINGGTLLDGDGLLPVLLGDDTVNIAKSATLNLNNDTTSINNLTGAGTVAMGTNASATLTLVAANFSGSITGSGQVLVPSGSTATLSGSNSYSGGTTLSGQVIISNNNSLGSGLITFNGGTLTSTSTLTVNNNINFSNGSAVNLQAAAGTTMTVSSDSASFGSLNFGSASETGTINFDPIGGNIFGGQLNVNGGTLVDGGGIVSQLLNTYTADIAQSATLNLNGFSVAIEDLTGAGTLATGTNSSATVTLRTANFSGSITGSGQVLIPSGGTATLSGSNSYTGGTTLKGGGQLVINSNNSLGSGPITLIGGTITATSNAAINDNYDDTSATSPITFQAAAGTTLTLGAAAAFGPETLNFGGAGDTGTVDFSPGGITFTNSTFNVNGGTLFDGDGILSQILYAQIVSIANSATLDLNNGSTTIGDLTGAGTLKTGTNSSETFTLQTADFTGNITGSGQLVTSNSTGTVILTGSNTYSGGTTLGGGTVGVGSGSALSNQIITVTGSTNLYAQGANQSLANPITINSAQSLTIVDDPNGAHNLTLNGNISGSGSLVASGTGTLTLHGFNSYSGGTTIGNGTLAITSSKALPAAGTVTNNSVLSIQAGTAMNPVDSGTITGTGSLNISGFLQLAAGSGTSEQGALSINAGSTLDVTNNVLVVNYGMNADPASTIRSELISGFNAGGAKWTGTGITSTLASANPTEFSVGYADGGDATDRANMGVAAGTVEIKYTVAGDANLSGGVDLSDLVIVASDFGDSGADWAEGDVNYDGNVDLSDLVIVASNFGASVSSVSAASFSGSFASEWQLALAEVHGADASVPEPGIAGLALAATFLARRRRQHATDPQ